VVDDDVVEFEGGFEEVLAGGETTEAEAAGVVGVGSAEGPGEEFGAEARPLAGFIFC